MKIDRFEKTLWSIALTLLFILVWAQIDMKLEYDEIRLKRQLQYQAFLEQRQLQDWRLAYNNSPAKSPEDRQRDAKNNGQGLKDESVY